MTASKDAIAQRLRAAIRPQVSGAAIDPLLSIMEKFALTDEEADELADPTWIEPGFVAQGHMIVIIARPNGGKTTIVFHHACQWADRYRVVYVDADSNPGDVKRMRAVAQEHGVMYVTPHMKVGQSMREVVDAFRTIIDSGADMSGQIWIFDTLKKMGDVINKRSLKDILNVCRQATGRGATVILLGHANKYKDEDGLDKFEGTQDLENDCDELIYFTPMDTPEGLTVSTRCTKRRAAIAEMTWTISKSRSVARRDAYVDVVAIGRDAEQREKDQSIIEVISGAIAAGSKTQSEIAAQCKVARISRKSTIAVLKRYRGKLWLESPAGRDNAREYRLTPQRGDNLGTTGHGYTPHNRDNRDNRSPSEIPF